MPVHGNLCYLEESINSILRQTYTDFELLIMDDGSPERVSIGYDLEDPRVTLFRQNIQRGVPATLNTLLDKCKGDFICRQDGDDISRPNRLEKQMNALNDGYDLVLSNYGKIDENSNEINDMWITDINMATVDDIKNNIHKRNYIVGGAPMWTRKVFERIGYFDEKLKVAQDYNYWIRILKLFEPTKLGDVLYYHRKHGNSHRLKTSKYMKDDNITIGYNELAQQRALEYAIIKERNM